MFSCQVEWAVSMLCRLMDVGQRSEGGDQLKAARETAAVEDGEAVRKHRQIDVQSVVVDKGQHKLGIGRMLPRLHSLGAGFYL